jgi:hypothetical protein
MEGNVRILVNSPAPGLRVHVRLLDTDRATVEATGPASSARFRTGPGRIEVANAGAGDLRIELPRSVAHAIVEVDGKLLFSKNGDEVHHAGSARTAGGDTVFHLHP